MVVYSRKVFFYETDAQGIVHHSNYPRYFEEARGYFLEKNNLPYEKIREELGLDVVLTQLSIEYKKYLTFGDSFFIHLKPKIENKYFFSFEYKLKNQKNKICCTGETKHCFISIKTKKIISIPKAFLDVLKD
ncbi:acyl-CoA thioesterase [Hydrogenothermus marinus]|uniref:Acyl-CoA thioester hydrolase n=1 Tax=Hydrogenothermus marinus TaxID=133270 RepID=A0A3M0BA79_9AQUI|nr:thioesterase family protein [Hydrogenothermus marinus]RMA93069.1 acyl-CoA thioester hydrolase [Hydrogenothermus marinus]